MNLFAATAISLSLFASGSPNAKARATAGSGTAPTSSPRIRKRTGLRKAVPNSPARDQQNSSLLRTYLNLFFSAPGPSRATGANATFEPGARTAWHTHPLGQTLIVTAATGWIQQWGGPSRRYEKAMYSTTLRFSRASVWMEKVSEEQYQKR